MLRDAKQAWPCPLFPVPGYSHPWPSIQLYYSRSCNVPYMYVHLHGWGLGPVAMVLMHMEKVAMAAWSNVFFHRHLFMPNMNSIEAHVLHKFWRTAHVMSYQRNFFTTLVFFSPTRIGRLHEKSVDSTRIGRLHEFKLRCSFMLH